MRQFIESHKLGRVAPIPYEIIRKTMPHTKLDIAENRKLNWITDWIWGNGYRDVLESSFSLFSWATDKITGGSDELQAVTESVGKENMDSFDDDQRIFPESVQASVD